MRLSSYTEQCCILTSTGTVCIADTKRNISKQADGREKTNTVCLLRFNIRFNDHNKAELTKCAANVKHTM